MPCVGHGTAAGLIPDEICDTYNGYAYGPNIFEDLRHQKGVFR